MRAKQNETRTGNKRDAVTCLELSSSRAEVHFESTKALAGVVTKETVTTMSTCELTDTIPTWGVCIQKFFS